MTRPETTGPADAAGAVRPEPAPPGGGDGRPWRIAFTPLTRADFPLLAGWLGRPHVRAWWPRPEPTVAAVEEEYGPAVDGADPMRAYLVRRDGEPVGLAQSYLHADEPVWDRAVGVPGAAGIDYLIGPAELRGRGLGSAAIRAFVPLAFADHPAATCLVAVPLAANRASRRALEKAGFRHLEDRETRTGDPCDAGISALYLLPRG